MDVTIVGTVKDENRKIHSIEIRSAEIENMLKEKAEASGIRGYEGLAWRHLDETIVSVTVEEI